MTVLGPCAFSLFLASMLAPAIALSTPAPRQPAEPATVTLGEAAAPPGAPVVAPLTLSAPEAVGVGTVSVELTYPKNLLTFVKIDPSGLALGVDAKVESSVKEGDGAQSTLLVKISTAGGSRKPLPSGPLAYVAFQIDKSAPPETAIAVKQRTEVLSTADPPQPIEPVVAAGESIRVTSPPVPACFFYMH